MDSGQYILYPISHSISNLSIPCTTYLSPTHPFPYPLRGYHFSGGKGTCKVWVGDVFIGYMVHGIWDGSPTPSTSASCMVWETMFLGMGTP